MAPKARPFPNVSNASIYTSRLCLNDITPKNDGSECDPSFCLRKPPSRICSLRLIVPRPTKHPSPLMGIWRRIKAKKNDQQKNKVNKPTVRIQTPRSVRQEC